MSGGADRAFGKRFLLARNRYLIGLGCLSGGLLVWMALKDQTVGNQQSPRNEAAMLCPDLPRAIHWRLRGV